MVFKHEVLEIRGAQAAINAMPMNTGSPGKVGTGGEGMYDNNSKNVSVTHVKCGKTAQMSSSCDLG